MVFAAGLIIGFHCRCNCNGRMGAVCIRKTERREEGR